MTMTIELARFAIRDGAAPQLVAERPAMVTALRQRYPACLAAYLTREDDGSWLDIVLWRSRAEAEDAARTIHTVPVCANWLRHITESGGLRHVEVVDAWPPTSFTDALFAV
jgi:hypothetical protein